ncbi:MAG: CHAD domain-containing protein [Acidiphilium sp.]|nr:CHAD domain-containing protein [Acidiphilium sp.]MDD4934488.1 CHAD domain-containing protein [Acidiphilium sp.]
MTADDRADVPLNLSRPGSRLILHFDGAIPAGLEDCTAVIAAQHGRFVTRRIKFGGFDTDDLALHRAGVSLWVQHRRRRFIQTLTVPASGPAVPDAEASAAVPGFAPVPALLPDDPAAPWRDGLLANAAHPIFTITIRRRQCHLDAGESIIGLAIDAGMIEAQGRSQTISEASLTLQHGSPAALFEIAARIFADHPFSLTGASPIARGYALAQALPPPACKYLPSELDPAMAADALMRDILRQCQAHILANHAAAADGRDPEGVHQLRVGLRRLRSAFRLLRDVMPAAPLRDLEDEAKIAATACGAARAWDVFLIETLPEIAAGCPRMVDFAPLRAIAETRRAAAYAAVRETLTDERYVRFHLALGTWIGGMAWPDPATAAPVGDFMAHALTNCHRTMLRRGKHFRSLTPPALHRLRIAAKILRYTADFFRPFLGHRGAVKHYFRRLATMQTQLGRYNDMATTDRLVEQIAGDLASADAQQAMGAIIGWEARGMIETAPQLYAAWREFRKADPPWPRHPLDDASHPRSKSGR